MTEDERLAKIHAYLDCIQRHIVLLPDKTDPGILIAIAQRMDAIGHQIVSNAEYSMQCRKNAAEARERVSAMIGTVN